MEVFSITLKIKENNLIEIFFTMFRIGLFTFGGGYAMLGVIRHEFVDKKRWITDEEMLDMTVISESLPGAIAINTSISVGYKIRGEKGAIAAVLGVICPSIIIITVITFFYNTLDANSPVWMFVKGIRAGVVGLLLSVILKLGKKAINDKFSILIASIAFAVAFMTDLPVILIIISGAILGCLRSRRIENGTD